MSLFRTTPVKFTLLGVAILILVVIVAKMLIDVPADRIYAVQKAYADAWAKNGAAVVPNYISGGGMPNAGGAADFIQLMTLNSARQLGLDMTLKTK